MPLEWNDELNERLRIYVRKLSWDRFYDDAFSCVRLHCYEAIMQGRINNIHGMYRTAFHRYVDFWRVESKILALDTHKFVDTYTYTLVEAWDNNAWDIAYTWYPGLLSELEREVLFLYLCGIDRNHINQLTQKKITRPAAKSRLYRAINKLREYHRINGENTL